MRMRCAAVSTGSLSCLPASAASGAGAGGWRQGETRGEDLRAGCAPSRPPPSPHPPDLRACSYQRPPLSLADNPVILAWRYGPCLPGSRTPTRGGGTPLPGYPAGSYTRVCDGIFDQGVSAVVSGIVRRVMTPLRPIRPQHLAGRQWKSGQQAMFQVRAPMHKKLPLFR